MNIISLVGIAIIACILCITIKPYQPVFAFAISATAGIYILLMAIQPVYELINSINMLINSANISSEIYMPVIKIVGISLIIRISCAICKDAGQQALSTKLEFIGSVACIILCFPLIEILISLISDILGIKL